MNALTAPLLHVQRSDALWLIPAVPLVGALVRAAIVDDDDLASNQKKLVAATAPAAVALALLGAQLFALGSLAPDARLLFSPGLVPFRVGTFEAAWGLALDPAAAVVAIAIAGLGVAAQALDKRSAATIDLAVAGALAAVLADGFLGFLIGGVLASSALAWIARDERPARAFFAARFGDAALVLGAVLLFWTLGGSWGISLGLEPTYTRHNPVPANVAQMDPLDSDEPDLAPTLHAVLIGSAPAPVASAPAKSAIPYAGSSPAMPDLSAKGSITVATAPGSKLFLKGAAETAGGTPVVRHEVYAGRIDVEVERPSGRRVRFRALDVPNGREIAIVPVGPTWSFRELRDELAIEDGTHQKFVRNLLDPAVAGHRRLGAWDAAHLLAALFGLAALAWIATVSFADDVLLGSFGGLLGVYLLARLEMVVVLSPMASGALAIVAGVLAIACAVGAAREVQTRRVVALLLSAFLSIAALGVLVGSPSLALVQALVATVLCGLLSIALERLGATDLRRVSDAATSAPRATRLLRVLAFALAGAPVPLLGAAFGDAAVLGRVFGAELPLSKFAWVLGAATALVVAWAVWRVWFLVCAGPGRKRALEDLSAPLANGLLAATVAVAVLAPLLSISRAFLGFAVGGERSVAEAFLDVGIDPAAVLGPERSVRLEAGRAVDLLVAFCLFGGAFAAWFFARRRFGDDDRAKPTEVDATRGAWFGASLQSIATAIARLDDLLFARLLGALAELIAGRRSP